MKTRSSPKWGEKSGATSKITWEDFKTQWVHLWRIFWPKAKAKPHTQYLPPVTEPAQPYNLSQLIYFIERGRRSYEKGISFDKWCERMIIVHDKPVIPYLREAWMHVTGGTSPIVTDATQISGEYGGDEPASHVLAVGVNGDFNWKTFLTKLFRTIATNKRKIILVCGLLPIVICGLFPPWLYTVYRTGTRDFSGMRSEKSAGYHCIFTPPSPEVESPTHGVKLDVERLLIEWACIVAACGATWAVFPSNKKAGFKYTMYSKN